MDIFDQASEMEAKFRSMSIDSVRRLASQQHLDAVVIRTRCAWCDQEIPEQRRLAIPGCDLCVSCQEQKEHLKEQR